MSEPGIRAFLQEYKRLIDNGIPPERVADAVFNAMREQRFYILPEAEVLKPIIRARMEDILAERNPRNMPLPMTGSLPTLI